MAKFEMGGVSKKLLFFHGLKWNKSIIYELVKRELKNKYAGSYLGAIWVFIEPIAFMFILWLVFHYGFRQSGEIGGASFTSYLMIGYTTFAFFNDTLNESTNAIISYSYLVKKQKFQSFYLPLIKLLTNTIIHIVLLTIIIPIFWINGDSPSLYYVQVVYYLSSAFLLLLGGSLILSSIGVFFQDLKSIVAILLRFSFWLTPIFWDIEMFSKRAQSLIKLNPMYYIMQGYRDSLLFNIPFWQYGVYTTYFHICVIITLAIGFFLFYRLSPHFPDVI